MTPEIRAHIFEPFFTTKEIGRGTGLGLSTVHGIVRHSGGYIDVQSEPNRGTQFRIYLPQTKETPDASIIAPILVAPARGCETILLAEDEAGIRAMTQAYLEGLGYHVLVAADGAEAVKISREHQGSIHLVLADLLMPVLHGDAAVTLIRELRPDIKALYISGYSEDQVPDRTAEVLSKPFEFPELGRRLRSVLGSQISCLRQNQGCYETRPLIAARQNAQRAISSRG